MERIRHLIICACVLGIICLNIGTVSAEVLVIYPEAAEPYQQAFELIMRGLAETVKEPVRRQRLSDSTTSQDVENWISQEDRSTPVILLGLPSLQHYLQGRKVQTRSVIVSGMSGIPPRSDLLGLSLTTDPALYIKTLRAIQTDLRKLVVYYDAEDTAWIERVRQVAGDLQMEAIPVSQASELIQRLGKTFQSMEPKTTALWFGHSTISLDTELIYPYVLKESWERGIQAVSETIAHVRRGFLLAFYPDYLKLGRELGEFVRQAPSGKTGVRFTQAGQLTINTRTAQHLGLNIPLSLIQKAKPVFPEP